MKARLLILLTLILLYLEINHEEPHRSQPRYIKPNINRMLENPSIKEYMADSIQQYPFNKPQILIQLLHCTLLLLAVVDELILCDAASAEARVHKILNGLSFTADMQQAPTKSLSGGWRMRLALAR